jgi:hypothetical protein
MNTGQTLLVVLAMILLAIFGLSINRTTLYSRSILQESSLLVSAISVGEKFIEEAELYRFDEDKSATIPSSFTYAGQLGPDAGESYPNFDDIDDYNGLTLVDNTSAHTPLNITIDVSYVDNSAPDTPITSSTYYKRMYVKVSSPYFAALPDSSIKLTRVFGYHYFWSDQWD